MEKISQNGTFWKFRSWLSYLTIFYIYNAHILQCLQLPRQQFRSHHPLNDPYFSSQWSMHSETPWETQIDHVWNWLSKSGKHVNFNSISNHFKSRELHEATEPFKKIRFFQPANIRVPPHAKNLLENSVMLTEESPPISLYTKKKNKVTVKSSEKLMHNADNSNKQTSKLPIVAVIDTGCDLRDPELMSTVWRNEGETDCYDGIDNDGNGYIDDCYGWNFVEDEPIRSLDYFNEKMGNNQYNVDHGTQAAGLIGSIANNKVGIAGVCLGNCQVMCLRAIDNKAPLMNNNDSPFPPRQVIEDRLIRAFSYSSTMGAQITTNSYGSHEGAFQKLQQLVDSVSNTNDKGHLFVVAAGNDDVNLDSLASSLSQPFSLPNQERAWERTAVLPPALSTPHNTVITVGASNRLGEKAQFSNYGQRSVDIFAPGVLIATPKGGTLKKKILNSDYCIQDGSVDFTSGTSVSTPIVAGSAALLWFLFPELHAADIKRLIKTSAQPSAKLRTLSSSGGTLNVWNAVRAAASKQRQQRKQ